MLSRQYLDPELMQSYKYLFLLLYCFLLSAPKYQVLIAQRGIIFRTP